MFGNTDQLSDQLQALIQELRTQKPIVQALLAIESGDRSLRWVGSADADGGKLDKNTPFFLASIDKLYNATIIMRLSEMGRLSLDDSIAAHLPSAVTQGLHVLDGSDRSENITIRHLLSHTSGLADWLEDRPKGGHSLLDQVLGEGDRLLSIEELATYVREQLQPHFLPQDFSSRRSKVRYSDTNFMLIIAIIEAVTGQPLHAVHDELLYKPLGLQHTFFPGASHPPAGSPQPMTLRANGQPLQIPQLMRSVRGIYSTTGDSLTFMRRLFGGEVFDHPATLGAMQNTWNRFGFPTDPAALRSPGWPIEYGLGIMRFRLPRLFTSMQALPAVLGHTGSTGCWMFWCPVWDLYIVGSVDEVTAGAVPYRIMPKILRILRPKN